MGKHHRYPKNRRRRAKYEHIEWSLLNTLLERRSGNVANYRLNLKIAFCAGLVVLAACAPPAPATAPAKLVPFPGTPTAACVQEEVLPKIEEIRPEEI